LTKLLTSGYNSAQPPARDLGVFHSPEWFFVAMI
jgi:hypothetical protein